MRTIKRTTRFKRDYKREKSGRHRKTRRYFDHALSGEWKDCRDCHIKPDLILIYRKPDAHTLELVRLGSHSELGL